jgi:ABC-type lipoprotein release transport system permease subunit
VLAVSRWLPGVLFGVGATDPPTRTGVVALLVAVAGAASWLPTRRAAAIDPVETIRPD